MSLQLILGSAGSGKSYQLYREIIDKSIQYPDTDYLIIVPEQFTLQTQKDIVTLHPNHGVMNVDILSFLRLAIRILDATKGNNVPILEDTGKSMVVRRVVAEKKKELILFGAHIKKTGFINELKSLLSEFYQYNISMEELNKLKNTMIKKPVLSAKLADILTIYQGFQDFIKERYITAEEILVVLSNVLEESDILKNSVVCLDGFTGFTPCQYKLIEKIMKQAKKVLVTVTIDPRENTGDYKNEHQLFALSKKTIHKLHQIAKETNTSVEPAVYADEKSGCKVPYRFRETAVLAAMEHNLFRYPYECYKEDQQDVSIHAMKDSVEEISFTAAKISQLVREEGYRYQDIAVVTGDIEQYGRIIKRIFTQHRIPCFVDYKKDILGNPFVELLRSLIAILQEDFSYESVFRYLKTGLSELNKEEIDLLENYVIATGIRGFKKWSEPFLRVYRTKEKFLIESINTIREKFVEEIRPLYEVLGRKEVTIKEYVTALYEHGVRLEVEQKLTTCYEEFLNKKMPTYAKEYEQIYRLVMELYDQIVLLLGNEKSSVKEFGEILETGLLEAKVGLIPPGVDEIVVGDTERTRLKDIKALFFVGVNDGIIPKSIGSGGILSDIEKELLSEHDLELSPTRRQQAYTEQFYIYLNLTKPQKRLYLTYHKLNDEGKAVRPSFIISKIQQLLPGIKIVDEDSRQSDMGHILSDLGITYLARGLRELGKRELTPVWKEFYLAYQADEHKRKTLNKLIEGAFYRNFETGITKEAAALLYGKELKGSVTRLEKYAACAFSHFLSFGLSLEERHEFKLAIPDIGNIFHKAIEDFSKRLSTSEYSWHTIPDEIRDDWAKQSVNTAVEAYENYVLKSTKRNEYLIKRMERITVRTLWALCNQIKQGDFEPVGYELPFYHIPDSELTLQGRIDRMDLYEDEDKVYVRVIDYKSGSTSFDVTKIYYGLQQQLLVYLYAAINYLKKEYKDKDIIPAGIFYYHIDDPIVAKTEQSEEEILRSLKMNGLVNEEGRILGCMDQKLVTEEGSLKASIKSDIIPIETNKDGFLTKRANAASNQHFESLMNYVNEKLVEDSKNILNGDIRLNPYRMENTTACDYCEYHTVCGFDRGLPGHNFRNFKKKAIEELKGEVFSYELDTGATEGN